MVSVRGSITDRRSVEFVLEGKVFVLTFRIFYIYGPFHSDTHSLLKTVEQFRERTTLLPSRPPAPT